MGTLKHSIASKKKWADVPQEERSQKMSDLAKLKWNKTSAKQKKDHITKMVNARKNGNSK